MVISFIKKFTPLALVFYCLLTLRSIIKRSVFRFDLKTGDRKNTATSFFSYLEFCNEHLIGKIKNQRVFETALEVGPGDNHAISLLVKECGVRDICTVDKFQISYTDEANYSLYSDISKRFGINDWKHKIDSISRLTPDIGINDLIDIKNRKFDLIYSVSVVEHLWPWQSYVGHMADLLEPNGTMVHIINFTDHGMFSPESNRFRFRTVLNPIYEAIMKPVGRPNRILPSQFIAFLENKGLEVKIDVIRTHTRVLNEGEAYNTKSIPEMELHELLSAFPSLEKANTNAIMDLCIGSATFTILNNDKSISN